MCFSFRGKMVQNLQVIFRTFGGHMNIYNMYDIMIMCACCDVMCGHLKIIFFLFPGENCSSFKQLTEKDLSSLIFLVVR